MQFYVRASDYAIIDNLGNVVELNAYHPLDDAHRYIFQRVNARTFDVQIKRGKVEVQRGLVKLLSFITERSATNTRSHVVELDASKPIWPIARLVGQLIGRNIPYYNISPLADKVLTELATTVGEPVMLSDGIVTRSKVPPKDGMPAYYLIRVYDASWAVLKSGASPLAHVLRVYLWMEAANKADEVLAAIAPQPYTPPTSSTSLM